MMSSGKKYSLLVFDWDGTLVNSEGLAVKTIQQIAVEFGYQPPSEASIKQLFGMSLKDIHKNLFPQHDNFPLFNNKFYANFTEEKLATSFFVGAIETLNHLKQKGFVLAIATNKPRTKLEAALDIANIRSLFAATRCPEDGGTKPLPNMLLNLLQELQYEATDTLMIGDTIFDMQFAQNANVDALAACYTPNKKEILAKYNPVGFIGDITELETILTPQI